MRQKGIAIKQLPDPETSLSQLELSRKLLRQASGSPDVLGVDVIWPYALKEHLIDLRPYLSEEIAAMDPELVAAYTVGGKLVAVPYQVQVGVLEYRADLLRKYGYKRPPQTWDELEKVAERIQNGERAKGNKDFWGYVWQGAASEGLTCNGLEWQIAEGGGRIIEPDGTISVNNAATSRAWQRARRWVGWISPPSVTQYRELDTMNAFDSGGAAFRRTWQWNYRLGHLRSSLRPYSTGYTSMPGGAGGRVGTLGGFGLAVSRYSEHQEQAIEFVRFLVRSELASQKSLANLSGPLELVELPSVLDPQNRTQRGDVVSRPSNLSSGTYEAVTAAYIKAVHSVLTGHRNATDATADLEKDLVAITGLTIGPPQRNGR
jgi:trehalose/maltose transport system substrate-binding protein